MKKRLQVSVRALVAHSLRSGDLNLESWVALAHPLDAIRAHQKVQGSRRDGYQKEVAISHVVEDEDFVLEVRGRIDGVWEQPARILIEEIKTTARDLEERAQGEEATDWGQLKTYAYLYAAEKDLDTIDVRLTYYQLETGETREIDRRFCREELGSFFHDLVARYLSWARRRDAWLAARDETIGCMDFPFSSYRPGQRAMAVQVYRAVRDGGQVLIEAPTGIGKTQAALFPAVKALGGGLTEKIFYLTARTTGRSLAEQALSELRAKGLRLKSVTLTAKEKICFNPEKACNGEECTFARGFYDRLDEALEELFVDDDFSRETIEALARKHHVCPFELSLELALWADCIICDYNYVFDPRVYLRRFFDEGKAPYTFLVDEAHNLIDRARDMYSAELRKKTFLDLRRSLDKRGRLYRALGDVSRWFSAARRRCESLANTSTEAEAPDELCGFLKGFVKEAAEQLGVAGRGNREILDCFFETSRFLKVAEAFDDTYVTCYEARGRDLRVKLFCTDPSGPVAETLSLAKASVFFSATLRPTEYFRTTLGLSEDAETLVLPSPFPPENLSVIIADRLATTYRRRDDTRETLSRLLATFVEQRKGNYFIYFPSYAYLRAVEGPFREARPNLDVVVQRPEITERERAAFLERFSSESDETLVGFAVMGGFFGEGIDLVGERLTGAAIVGVGLPALSPERDCIRDYFDRERSSGFEYAYVFPGMNRVLQAAGRVIRSETDRGTILLIDERFTQNRYRSLLPREWSPLVVRDASELRQVLEPVFSTHQRSSNAASASFPH